MNPNILLASRAIARILETRNDSADSYSVRARFLLHEAMSGHILGDCLELTERRLEAAKGFALQSIPLSAWIRKA